MIKHSRGSLKCGLLLPQKCCIKHSILRLMMKPLPITVRHIRDVFKETLPQIPKLSLNLTQLCYHIHYYIHMNYIYRISNCIILTH